MFSRPPSLVARTLTVTFTTVAVILTLVFIVLTVDARDRVRDAERDKLAVSERVFATLEARRQQEQLALVATLAENPTLKAALATYVTERSFSGLTTEQETSLRTTVRREAEKLAAMTSASSIAIVGPDGRVFTSAGPARDAWPAGQQVALPARTGYGAQGVVALPAATFLVTVATLRLETSEIGTLVLGTTLDEAYAAELANLSRAGVVITVRGAAVASTLPRQLLAHFMAAGPQLASGDGMVPLGGEEYAVRTLLASGPARIVALTSIDSAARAATRDALSTLALVALGSFVLAALGSFWLARTLSEPINRASQAITTMTASREFTRALEPTRNSRELDALTAAFNEMMRAVHAAEQERQSAYVGAIRALAAALDARDPYTAGHSERVSVLSVAIGVRLQLSAGDLEVLRLGALLHDIGKIGVPDEILRKPGPLTDAEFEQIKRHPGLGARILRQVPFLEPHLPIVELHHERPDGRGYPFGLRGEAIPPLARIVHVADAFDAITTARAYRPGREAAVALAELQAHVGTQFDATAVEALAAAFPDVSSALLREPQPLTR